MASLVTPWVLRVAVTLRLPDLIGRATVDVDELAVRAGANPDALRRVARHLVHCGVLRHPAPDRLELTALGHLLRSDHPARLVDALDQANPFNRREAAAVARLLDAVRDGRPVWAPRQGHEREGHERHGHERQGHGRQGHGRQGHDLWSALDHDPELAAGFDQALAGAADQLTEGIARAFDWESVAHVVDVGGGTGRVLAALLTAHPRLRGTLVDLPPMAEQGRVRFAGRGLAERVAVSGQSFFDPLPRGGDVYLLANVLHCWNDEDSRKVLGQCVAAAPSHALVVVVDQVLPEDPADPAYGALVEIDLGLLVLLGTALRDQERFRLLGESAGLTLREATRIAPHTVSSLLTYTIDD
ncbi:methyltransferase [Streptoalloteichus tenebrarius]